MPDIFELLKDLAKTYSFSIQDILKDLFSGDKSNFSADESQNTASYYEKMLYTLDNKLLQLDSELKELKKLRASLEKKFKQAKQKESENQNHNSQEDFEKEKFYQNSRFRNKSHRSSTFDEKLAKHYAALELPYGSDMPAIQKAYRSLLKKYHPDYFAHHSEKQQTATLITQKITEAYQALKKHFS